MGRVTAAHVVHNFHASRHAACDALVKPFDAIERIVRKMFEQHKFQPKGKDCWDPARIYTENEVTKELKGFMLPMLGSWTTQHSYTWECETANFEEDVSGDAKRISINRDGGLNLMRKKATARCS